MKTLHTVVAVVGIAAAGAAAWWVQHKEPAALAAAPQAAAPAASGGGAAPADASGGGPVSVEVARAATVRIEDDAQSVGSLRSRQGVMLRPEVPGRIARIGFADGQRVRRGQLLVQLDDTLQRAQLQQSQAQASIARTNLQRNRELVAQNFVSASAVDQSAAALEVAEAQVALSRAQLERMRILAPFDGVAGIALVNLGDFVKDGADLVNIEDASSMSVDFRLPERYLARLKTGQSVEVQVDALPGRGFQGRIDAVDSQVDANGRSLLVRARLPNPKGELKAGMFARTRTVFAVREQAVVVPEEALVPQAGRQYLIKVVDGPAGKVSQRVEARLGMRLPGRVEILDGVAAGDLIVTAGQAKLRDDKMPVSPVEIGAAR
ncbi:efflux RND transporter periplasmic adaptor subunit [Piscinibacter sp.]|uniref:efflux RND transporter periplasmic adaptor subunit n=1 Tax=Piscinibacter sp. TaxID=1903157 RepID=UPI0039E3B8C0